MHIKKIFLSFLSVILFFSLSPVIAQNSGTTTPKPYEDNEFPQGFKDLRRFEIITLGSMPFVMLDSTIAYSTYKGITGKSESFNIFDSSSYTYEETKNLILTSLGISLGIALSDYIVNLIKRSSKKKQTINTSNFNINTVPYDYNFNFDDSDYSQAYDSNDKEESVFNSEDDDMSEFLEIEENFIDKENN